MAKYDFLIVGAGLAGSVFAYETGRRGKTCIVVEKRAQIGGNLYTEQVEGIGVHKYGAHIFHTDDDRIWNYVNKFAEFNNYINSPIANYKGEIYNLPFNMNTFNELWGVSTPEEAERILAEQRAEIKGEPENLEEQAIKLAGRDVFEKLIKGYTEKQWGRACKELPASIIKRIPISLVYNNNYFPGDRFQGIPIGGYTQIVEKMLANAEIRLETDFLQEREELTALADKIVYTGPIDAYFERSLGNLEYRSLRFEEKVFDEKNKQGVAVVNYTDAATPYTRSIEHKHFEFGEQEKTVVTYEYPADFAEGSEAYYPIRDEKNLALYEKYRELAAAEKNVIFLGRLAEYRYYDMDEVIAAALDVVMKQG